MMTKLREKIILKAKGSAYIVQSLENRITPFVGNVLNEGEVTKLLLEAKVSGALTVKVI
jgi:hypothetical protein